MFKITIMGGLITKKKSKKKLINSNESIPIASVNLDHQIVSLKVFPEYLGDLSNFKWAPVIVHQVNSQDKLDKYSNSEEWNLFFKQENNKRICKIDGFYYYWKYKN